LCRTALDEIDYHIDIGVKLDEIFLFLVTVLLLVLYVSFIRIIGLLNIIIYLPQQHFGRRQRSGSMVSLLHVILSARMTAFSLSLPSRHLDGDDTVNCGQKLKIRF